MIETYKKCIGLFSQKNPYVLIITNEENENILSWCKENAVNIDYMSLKGKKEKWVLEKLLDSTEKEKGDISQYAAYDLVILDRVCESPLLNINSDSMIWKNRQEFFYSISKKMTAQSSLVIFSVNEIYLRKPSVFLYASINLFLRTFFSGVFTSQLVSQLKKAGFSRFDSFYIYPELAGFSQLISNDKKAFRDAMQSKYGLPLKIYRYPKFWFRWLVCYLRLDSLFLLDQMIWIRK